MTTATPTPSHTHASRRRNARPQNFAGIVGPVIFIWVAYVGLAALGSFARGPGWLVDSDCYSRLMRLREIVIHGQFPFERLTQVNPPHGDTMLYTHPLDVLLLLAGLVARPFCAGWEQALYAGSLWLSPALFIVLAVALIWAGSRIAGRLAGFATGLLLVAHAPITGWFVPFRPDHHSLLLLTASLAALGFVAHQQNPRAAGFGLCLGSVAVGFWTSIESSVIAAATVLGFCAAALVASSEERSRAARDLVAFTGFLGTLLGFAYVLEHGFNPEPAWFLDSLSLRQSVALSVFALIAGLLHPLVQHGSLPVRAATLIAAGGMAILAFLGPSLLAPTLISAEDRTIWYVVGDMTSDMRPLIDHEQPIWLMAAYWLGPAFFLLPWSGMVWLQRARLTPVSRWFILLLTVAYALLSAKHMRWTAYADIGAALITGCALATVGRSWLRTQRPDLPAQVHIRFLRVGLLATAIALSLAPRLTWLTFASATPSIEPVLLEEHVVAAGEAWNADRAERGIASRRVLTYMMMGASLGYRWNADILATPYPRNTGGIRQASAWFLSGAPAAARDQLLERDYRYAFLLTSNQPTELRQFRRLEPDAPPIEATFHGALARPDIDVPGIHVVGQWPVTGATNVFARLIRFDPPS